MANKIEFNVLVSGMEDVKKQFSGLADKLEDFSKVTKQTGRELKELGGTLSLLGATISGPLILAFKNSAKASEEVANQLSRMDNIASKFQKELAVAVVPVFEKFNNVLNNLYNAFLSLDPAFRNQLLQSALLTGVMLTLSGLFTIIIGKVFLFASNLAGLASKFLVFATLNPIFVGIAVSIAILVALMIKFKGVADVVLSTFQVLFILLENGFRGIKIAFELTIAGMLDILIEFSDVISKLPSVLGAVVREFSGQIEEASASLRTMAEEDIVAVNERVTELGNIITTGVGSWSMGFDEFKKIATDAFDSIGQKGANTIGALSVLEQKGLEISKKVNADKVASLASTLQQAAQLNSKFGTAYKAVAIGEAIVSTAAGVARALKDYKFPLGLAVGALVAAAGAVQIGTIASQSFAVGTPKIPHDMTAQVHKNEMIIPATFSDAIRSGDLSLSGSGNGGGSGITIDLRGSEFNGITDSMVEKIFRKASENLSNRTLAFRSA